MTVDPARSCAKAVPPPHPDVVPFSGAPDRSGNAKAVAALAQSRLAVNNESQDRTMLIYFVF